MPVLPVVHPTAFNVVSRLSKLSDPWCSTKDPEKVINLARSVDNASSVLERISLNPDDPIEGIKSSHTNSKSKNSVERKQGSSSKSTNVTKAAGSAQTSSLIPKNLKSAPTTAVAAEPALFTPFQPEVLKEMVASTEDAPYVPPWKRFESPQIQKRTAKEKPAESPSLAHLESIVNKLLPTENSTKSPKSAPAKSGKVTDRGDVAVVSPLC